MIIPGENGCCGGNIPISHFLLSLTHSALIDPTGVGRYRAKTAGSRVLGFGLAPCVEKFIQPVVKVLLLTFISFCCCPHHKVTWQSLELLLSLLPLMLLLSLLSLLLLVLSLSGVSR